MKDLYNYFILNSDGTYIGVNFDRNDVRSLLSWASSIFPKTRFYDIKDIHTTIHHSTVPILNWRTYDFSKGKTEYATTKKLNLFGKEDEALVVEIYCPFLEHRHNIGLKLGARFDWKKYVPHITLTDNFKGKYPKAFIRGIKVPHMKLRIVNEYVQPINL